jgi:hypothetical protein
MVGLEELKRRLRGSCPQRLKRIVKRLHRGEHYLAVMYATSEVMELRYLMFYVSLGLVVVGIGVEVATYFNMFEEEVE